ncbi:flippase [Mucilaginibacter gynuensis]|uniref:Flippase n=1 Tax=Mucilaginibacter gynuensis TaxID=1302236 RepID=A0ABP8GXJ2_9SPHI
MSKFVKDLASVMTSKVLVIVLGLVRSIIIARWLGPANNGIIAAISVYPSLFMTIGALGIRQSTAFYVGKNIYPEEKVKRSIIHIWLLSTFISIIICFFLIHYFSSSGDNLLLVFLAIMPIPFSLFVDYNSGLFLGKNQIQQFNRVNWLPIFFVLIATVLLVILAKWGIVGAMASAVMGPLLMALIMLRKNEFYKYFTLSIDKEIIVKLLSLGVTYAIALLVINLNYRVDVIILDRMSTDYQLGIYSKSVNIIEMLWQIPMMLSTIVFAGSANSKNSREFSVKVHLLLRLSIIIIAIGSIVLLVLSKFVVLLMFGKAFVESASVLQYLLPGILLLTIFKVLNMDMAGRGKPWISMKAMVPALLLNIVLNIILDPSLGARGSAISTTISYIISALLFLHFYSKEVQIPILEILKFSKKDFDIAIEKIKRKKPKEKYESL